ncbi:hypothetical protein ACS0TY_013158 [Phlomoides rotata]
MHSTDIRVNSHIHSKIITWKKLHSCLQTTLVNTKVLDVSDSAWATVMKLGVFGMDRANGAATEDVVEAFNQIDNEENVPIAANPPPLNNVILKDVKMDVESQTATGGTLKTALMTSGKKRPHLEVVDTKELVTILGAVFKSSDDHLDDIVNSIGYEAHSATSHQNIFSVLEQIPELTLDECLDASEILCRNTQRMGVFIDIPTDAHPPYMRRLLNGDFDTPK